MDQAPRPDKGESEQDQLLSKIKDALGVEVLNVVRKVTEEFRTKHPFPSSKEIRQKSSKFSTEPEQKTALGYFLKYKITPDGGEILDFALKLSNEIFYPNFERFINLVRALPLIDDMARFVEDTNTPVDFNVRNFIFPTDAYNMRAAFPKRDVAKNEIARIAVYKKAGERYKGTSKRTRNALPKQSVPPESRNA